jgi:hypothetical protein
MLAALLGLLSTVAAMIVFRCPAGSRVCRATSQGTLKGSRAPAGSPAFLSWRCPAIADRARSRRSDQRAGQATKA